MAALHSAFERRRNRVGQLPHAPRRADKDHLRLHRDCQWQCIWHKRRGNRPRTAYRASVGVKSGSHRRRPAFPAAPTLVESSGAGAVQPPPAPMDGLKMLRFLTAGESHGPELVAVVEGYPAGFDIDLAKINHDLARR